MSLFAEELQHRIDQDKQALATAVAQQDEDLAEALRADLEDLRSLAIRHGATSFVDA
jgi:hypothetical protein